MTLQEIEKTKFLDLRGLRSEVIRKYSRIDFAYIMEIEKITEDDEDRFVKMQGIYLDKIHKRYSIEENIFEISDLYKISEANYENNALELIYRLFEFRKW
jgi:hypothetical protein